MAINSDLHLWRTVLALALRDDDAARWLASEDGATVCALAGVERDAVVRAYKAGLPEIRKRAA